MVGIRRTYGRSPWVLLEGEPFRLISYGDERDDDGVDFFSTSCHLCGARPQHPHSDACPMGPGLLFQRSSQCRDCGCHIGEIHTLNCGIEQCPRCGGQYASCDCNGSEDRPDEDEDPDQ